MRPKIHLLPGLLALANLSTAQDPLIGPQIRLSSNNLCLSASETTGVASNDGQEIVAGFVDYRADNTFKTAFAVTSDGGSSWSHIVVRPPTGFQASTEADPMTAYDARTGTLFAGGISAGKCLYVARKTPGQNQFEPSVVARVATAPDKGWMAAGPRPDMPDSTRLYITYNEGVVWSDDLGTTWSPPVGLGVGYGFLPRVGPQGELDLTYWDGYWGIKFTQSLDGGATWSSPVQIATRLMSWGVTNYGVPGQFRDFTNNTMAVNPVNGDIVIIYFDQTNIVNGQKNLDLYMVRSQDHGQTWTDSERLPFRPIGQVSDMVFPWLEFTRDGRLHLFAMDTSYNPGQTDGLEHGYWDQVYYTSDDSGATWSAKFRLTPTSWDSYYDGNGYKFLGDYQGMAVSDKTVFPIYPDTSTHQAECTTNPIYNPIVRPGSFDWFRGSNTSGSLSNLFLHDANSAQAHPGFVANATEPPVQLETTTTGLPASPTSLSVRLWASSSVQNVLQTVRLKNVLTGQWELLDSRMASQALTQTDVTVANPGQYITGNALQLRIAFKAVGFVPTFAWAASVDQSVLLVVP